MIVRCIKCKMYFEDALRRTYCPHPTFPANDGANHFAHHPGSYLSNLKPNPDNNSANVAKRRVR